jgi:predicted glycoside hydrolase/deacetylase ChbG (UPF0249 family)
VLTLRQSPGTFALCADDFALSETISRAILDLVDAGRLTAVSAMASTPGWSESAGELAARRGRVAVGLHLDLTHRPYDGRRPSHDLRRLVIGSLTGRLDVEALSAEFERQFDRFEAAFGYPPDHVDGHCHVHALPQARAALFSVLSRRFAGAPTESRPLVRDPADSPFRILLRGGARAKALAVAGLAARFAARAAASGFATNVGFAGFSNFVCARRYEREFDQFLLAPGSRHLVMCHPGLAEAAASRADPIAAARADEHAFLGASEAPPPAMLRISRRADDPSCAFVDWLAAKDGVYSARLM